MSPRSTNDASGFYDFSPSHMIYTERVNKKFEGLGTAVSYPKNTMLYKAGDIPDCCYYIKQGRIISFEYTSSGEERIYNLNEEGSLVFEPCVILGRKLSLNFKTITSATLIRIPRSAIADMMTDPEFAHDLLCSVSEKFLEVNEQIRESACHSVGWKVCNLLLSYAYRFGVEYDGKTLIKDRISQQMMANILRVNRVTVARTMRELKDIGIVEQINGYYCIRSISALKKHMLYIDTETDSKK